MSLLSKVKAVRTVHGCKNASTIAKRGFSLQRQQESYPQKLSDVLTSFMSKENVNKESERLTREKAFAAEYGCDLVAFGRLSKVWLRKGQEKDIKKTKREMLKRFQSLAKRYCDHGSDSFNETQFKFVKKGKDGDATISLHEFKAYQLRMYGCAYRIKGETVFVVTKIDPEKKQNKANSRYLDQAIERCADFGRGI